jgi:hypothetical protein
VPSRRSLLVPLLAAGLLSGCAFGGGSPAASTVNGIADSSAADVLRTSVANAKAESSLRVVGTGSCTDGSFSVDMHLRSDETGFGTVKLGADSLKVVSTTDALYVQAPATFWTALSSSHAASTIGQKWVRLSRASSVCISAITSFSSVLANYLGYPGAPTKQPESVIFGTPAVLLELPHDVSFWVSTQGTPLPVRITDPAAPTAISLVEWGTPVTVTIPQAADVVDGSTLATKS